MTKTEADRVIEAAKCGYDVPVSKITESLVATGDMKRKRPGRCGWVGYLRIIAALRDKPMTIGELGSVCGIGKFSLYLIVPQLHRGGAIRVCGSRIIHKQHVPIYSADGGEDVDVPHHKPYKMRHSPEIIGLCTMLDTIMVPSSTAAIREATGSTLQHIRRVIGAAMALDLVHLAKWELSETGGPAIALYAAGPGRNARKPTAAEISKMIEERNSVRRRDAIMCGRVAHGAAPAR